MNKRPKHQISNCFITYIMSRLTVYQVTNIILLVKTFLTNIISDEDFLLGEILVMKTLNIIHMTIF